MAVRVLRRIGPPPGDGAARRISPTLAVTTVELPAPPEIEVSEPDVVRGSPLVTTAAPGLTPADLATGRVFQYEWENFVDDLLTRVNALESIGSPAGQGGSYRHRQVGPAATWSITHGLNTTPSVTVVDNVGELLLVETSFPDPNTAVLTFGSPISGYAYLRG